MTEPMEPNDPLPDSNEFDVVKRHYLFPFEMVGKGRKESKVLSLWKEDPQKGSVHVSRKHRVLFAPVLHDGNRYHG